MAKNLVFYDCEDEEYIEMMCCSTNSSPKNREFEFQMSESTIFPADELFYKGKLLPLYLPRRLPALETHFVSAASAAATFATGSFGLDEHDYYTLPKLYITCSSTAPCTNSNTPLDSCNISPSESCMASFELDRDDYFVPWSPELSRFVDDHRSNKNYSLCKKIQYSFLGQKLRSSRDFLKSLFIKSSCSKESDNLPKTAEVFKTSKNKVRSSSHPTLATIMKNMNIEDHQPRRSFSRAIKRRSSTNYISSVSSNSSSEGSSSSSSFSSSHSNGIHPGLEFLRRSRIVTEMECSIEAAIAHCKKSQKID